MTENEIKVDFLNLINQLLVIVDGNFAVDIVIVDVLWVVETNLVLEDGNMEGISAHEFPALPIISDNNI